MVLHIETKLAFGCSADGLLYENRIAEKSCLDYICNLQSISIIKAEIKMDGFCTNVKNKWAIALAKWIFMSKLLPTIAYKANWAPFFTMYSSIEK